MKTKIQEKSTLLAALRSLSPDSSNNTLKEWVAQGRVLVNGKAPTSWEVMPGQEVQVGPRCSFAEEGIKILYEDRYLVVIEKPKGLLSVATLLENELTAQAILSRRAKCKVFAVHRLDQETSGVMMFVYTARAQEMLKEQFANHTIERVYLGLVKGHLTPSKGTWRSYLEEDDFYFVKSSTNGQLAITHYEVIKKKGDNSLVKFTLQTGKKNQIRVHASEAGHPIIGDKKYGYSGGPLCLHAHVLAFFHPFRKKMMRFVSAF
jgi:tRNA pseudouridine32 synthase/23S rRNA pseudouridine746 synthase/23S rRNA pseudouridine1911/1915/1917 synthase